MKNKMPKLIDRGMSFASLWENLQTAKTVNSGGEDSDFSKAKEAVKKGLNPSLLKNKNFWEIFMDLCNNQGPGLAELLDIPVSKISNWASNINNVLQQVDDEEVQDDSGERNNVIYTGNEPKATDSEDPTRGDAYKVTQPEIS